jgi:hypothetical protein
MDMCDIELSPTLSHCIETVAKEEFWQLVNQYMESKQEDKRLEQKIELLRVFLESMDFKELRRKSESYLIAGKAVKFIIYLKEGKPHYEMIVS